MADGPVSEILFRTAIAAINNENHLRVYTQDVEGGIRESLYEGGWANGTSKNVVAKAKIGSPIAAITQKLNEIRVYYISNENILCEAAYSANRGWFTGDLNSFKFKVAPYSTIGACYLENGPTEIRVYAQAEDNTIQEYGVDGDNWKVFTNLGKALPGTAIAAIAYRATLGSIRVYYQNTSLALIEQAHDGSNNWYIGAFKIANALPRTAIAAVPFEASSAGVRIRVYYAAAGDKMLEKAWDGKGWYDGGFVKPTIPGSQVSAIAWGTGSGLNLRVYLENGTDVTGVTEWMWRGGWSLGISAIPPA